VKSQKRNKPLNNTTEYNRDCKGSAGNVWTTVPGSADATHSGGSFAAKKCRKRGKIMPETSGRSGLRNFGYKKVTIFDEWDPMLYDSQEEELRAIDAIFEGGKSRSVRR
jgi:hypothetical protein